jgi:hypothetical protein
LPSRTGNGLITVSGRNFYSEAITGLQIGFGSSIGPVSMSRVAHAANLPACQLANCLRWLGDLTTWLSWLQTKFVVPATAGEGRNLDVSVRGYARR